MNVLKKKPDVSVVITTYNHEKFIAQAIDSVLMQEVNFNFEIIIGEDESEDNTRKIVMAYKNRNPEIRLFLRSRKDVIYINNEPTGRYNFIRNLQAAKGKYIALLEGDDYWVDKKKLQKQYDFLENNKNYTVCFHIAEIVDVTGKLSNKYWQPLDNKAYYTKEDLFLRCNFIPTASVMFVNRLFNYFPDWFYSFNVADWPLHILNSSYGKIKFIDEVMSAYRVHPSGISSSKSGMQLFHLRLEMYDSFKEIFGKKYYYPINKAVSLVYYKLACLYEEKKDKKNALKYVLKNIFWFYYDLNVFKLKLKLLLRIVFPHIYKKLKDIKSKIIK